MKPSPNQTIRVVAISPTNAGFGFAVFEGPDRLIDWGLKTPRVRTNVRQFKAVTQLFQQYAPDIVVIEDLTGTSCRRGRKAKQLLAGIERLASRSDIKTVRLKRFEIKKAFAHDL